MKRIAFFICFLLFAGFSFADTSYVKVLDGQLYRGGEPYYYIGTNFWYGPILGSTGQGGDRQRLNRELDALKALGINNLRILFGADEGSRNANTVYPALQSVPGQLNDTLLTGMDYLLDQMARRDMVAVIYLTNSWDWSGGFGFYLKNTGHGDSPSSDGDGYNNYIKYASQFVKDPKSTSLFYDFLRKVITRKNSVNGKAYADDPTIMSWQICNEPRPFMKDAEDSFATWIHTTATLIHQLDPHHLVSTGSEGVIGCNLNPALFERVHADPAIDYLTIHIWPLNWQWAFKATLWEDLQHVYLKTGEYINQHVRLAQKLYKPLVIEEFGYARDRQSYEPGSFVLCRDAFYSFVMNKVIESFHQGGYLSGCNFWGWGGEARPIHERWQQGDPYVCDPPHEPQGWYSVFDNDSTTLSTIKNFTLKLK